MMRVLPFLCILLACGGCRPQGNLEQRATAAPSPAASSPRTSARAPSSPALPPTARAIVDGARSCLGDVYDDGYFAGGPPPRGRGACTDVLYWSLLRVGVNTQKALNADARRAPRGYPNLRDDNIDYRWAPDLIVWFRRHTRALPLDADWAAGDVVFWSLTNDGVADHCGIVSDRAASAGRPLVIHNFPPACREDDALHGWTIVGHFRVGSR